MKSSTKRRIGFGGMLSLAVVSVAALSSMNASAVIPPEATAPNLVPYGSVTIEISSRGGVVTFDPAGDGANVTQPVRTVQPCSKIVFDPTSDVGRPGDLIILTPIVNNTTKATDTVQIPSDAIGVHDSTNCGGPAGLVGPNEKLRIGLGSYFDAAVTASTATLVVGKSNTQDGKLIVAFGSEVQAPRTVNVSGQTFTGLKPTTGTFKEITMSSDATQSSRGLSAKSGTALNLVVPGGFNVAVKCGETVTDVGGGGDIATRAQFYRGENLAKQTTTCSDVGATVEIIPGGATTSPAGSINEASVFWNNGATGVNGVPQAVSGTVTVNWAGVSNPADLAREIDYDAQGAAFGWQPVVWCTSYVESDIIPLNVDGTVGNGILEFAVTRPNVIKTIIPRPASGSTTIQVPAPWCLVSNSETLQGNQYLQTQVFHGQGDPQAR